MKKKISLILGIVCLIALFTGCTGGKTSNKEVIESIKSGLEARWDYQDSNNDNDTALKEMNYIYSSMEIELNAIKQYKEVEFEEPELGELVKEYISVLEEGMAEVNKAIEDNDYWRYANNFYYVTQIERCKILNKINNIVPIEFSKSSNQRYLSEILDETSYDIKSEYITNSFEFTKTDYKAEVNCFGNLDLKVKVKNNLPLTYDVDEVEFIYRVIDEDGTVVVDKDYEYISNFKPGDNAILEIYCWNDFSPNKHYTVEIYGYNLYYNADGCWYSNCESNLSEPFKVEIK